MSKKTIVMDVMGESAEVTTHLVQACHMVASNHLDLEYVATGDEKLIPLPVSDAIMFPNGVPNFSVHHCSDYIHMGEKLTPREIRERNDASSIVALRLVAEGKAHAVLSSGNTGAYVTGARAILGKLSGFRGNPVLAAPVPSGNGKTQALWLDVGAHHDPEPKNFPQMASMGALVMRCLGVAEPRIGLLNIGEEESKGSYLYKEAYKLLMEVLGFVGNVEGSRIYDDLCDVLLMCAQVGNILIKSQEGLIRTQVRLLKQLYAAAPSPETKNAAETALMLYKKMMTPYTNTGGALILGVGGLAGKMHGGTTYEQAVNSLELMSSLVEADFYPQLLALLADAK